MDSASNNDTLMLELETLFKTEAVAFDHEGNRVR